MPTFFIGTQVPVIGKFPNGKDDLGVVDNLNK